MNKAIIISPAAMSEEQVDVAMTPFRTPYFGFKISDLALQLHPSDETIKEESPSIQWIELRKIYS
jgi:hypothetical protein